MGEPIILDKNVLTSISRNNAPAAEALSRYLGSGTPVYISRAAYDELVTRAQTPRQAGEYEWLLKDAGITIAPDGPMIERLKVLADNIEHVPSPGRPQLKDFSRKDDPTKPGDAFVVAQAKAVNGKLWTFDQKVQRAAPGLGVKLADECRLGAMSGVEDVSVGRKLLGLKPRPMGMDGKPVAPHGSDGGRGGQGGSFSMVGVADELPQVGGPSARGVAIVGGIQIAFEGANFVLNLINDYVQKQRVDTAMDAIRPAVQQARQANPTLGVLLLFYYMQYQAPEDSIIKPGAEFHYVQWGIGATRDEALQDATKQATISAGPGRNQDKFSREMWIPPLQKTQFITAKAPFKPIALGRFALEDNEATFQLVSFDTFGGFDDIVTRSIDLPDGRNADFVILKSPHEVFWFNINGSHSVSVPLKNKRTANGKTVAAVDLDPYSPFNATAVMIFPLDDWAERVFRTVRVTEGYHALNNYINMAMVRWVRPENLELVRML